MKESTTNNLFTCSDSTVVMPIHKKTVVIRKKKRPTSFERRFLSAKTNSSKGVLEVAMVWNDNVMSIKQYHAKPGTVITVGSNPKCNYKVNTNTDSIPLLHCSNNNTWEVVFNTTDEGFILEGEKKLQFKNASSSEFKVPSLGKELKPGSLSTCITGNTRAKFVFGDVSILVHYVESKKYKSQIVDGVKICDCSALIASILLHIALFSVVFLSTDRVDALMVDRVITSSRFATTVEAQIEDDVKVDDSEVVEPDIEDGSKNIEPGNDSPAMIANQNNNSNGVSLSSSDARSAAQGVGLLNQSNAINSMLAAAMDVNLDVQDWSTFDGSVAAVMNSYSLNTTGTGGGSSNMGNFGVGDFGPNSGNRSNAITTAAINADVGLGKKKGTIIKFQPKAPEVNGTIDKRIIQKIVRQHTGELRSCYERELAKVKGLNGRVVAVWVIDMQGSVAKAGIKESTMNNSNVENCMINFIKSWRFPTTKGGGMASVEYPFVFETGN